MAEVARGETTADTLFGGRVALAQPAKNRGYRVNVDAILLAAFAAGLLDEAPVRARKAKAAFDLGSGVGAVGLSLLHLGGAAHVTMVEIDPILAGLAEENAIANGWQDRIEVRLGSVTATTKSDADLVVCNPPYVPPGRGRAPHSSRATAKMGSLDDFVYAARKLAGRRARACFVYPAIEATTLLGSLRAAGLEPKRLRTVHGKPGEKARVVLVEAVAGKPGGLVIETGFVETEGKGRRSSAVERLLAR